MLYSQASSSPPFFRRDSRASETRARVKITLREKRRHAAGRQKNEGLQTIFLSPRRVSPFLAWGDFHARSRFARSTFPKEKWGTTRSLQVSRVLSYLRGPALFFSTTSATLSLAH